MAKNTRQLYFAYQSTARIRIRKENCLYCDNYPLIYRIVTDKLDFTVPRHAVIIGKGEHVYVSLHHYRQALDNFYQSIRA